ncbi:MAG: UDP-N-acetylglucosamine 2-epimerase (hydrolyzing) [Bacteroidetes bacterium]|nr:UDP-N-acetylglucosamine 2-epimerase (hydrolyzing) [Bacteroidota bacterium]
MGRSEVKRIALLTCGRSDYSIYRPLIELLFKSKKFNLDIIALGTHVSRQFGYTLDQIKADGFSIKYTVESLVLGDSPEAISSAMGLTTIKTSSIWAKENYDLLICLGDRYEMYAAVLSSIPFNIPVAHISGGETTTGAIDNIFRHSLSLTAKYHFTSTEKYKNKVSEIIGSKSNVYNVGALSIDNLKKLKLYSIEEFKKKFNIGLKQPSILITFHPETVSHTKNSIYINELIKALNQCANYQLVITMPNSDTQGDLIREKLNNFIAKNKNAIGVESFGTIGYLSCMKHCSFLLGNTSSGFVEASFFPKHVINLGDRQNGRIITSNILNCEIKEEKILSAIKVIEKRKTLPKISIYGNGNTAQKIVSILEKCL